MLSSAYSNTRIYFNDKLSATLSMLKKINVTRLLAVAILALALHFSLSWGLSYVLSSAYGLQWYSVVQGYLGRNIFMYDVIMNVASLAAMAYTANSVLEAVPYQKILEQSIQFTQNAYQKFKSKMLTFQIDDPTLEGAQVEIKLADLILPVAKKAMKVVAKTLVPKIIYTSVTNRFDEQKRLRRGLKELYLACIGKHNEKVEHILNRISSDELYQYLKLSIGRDEQIIQSITFHRRDKPELLKRIIDKLEASRRFEILGSITYIGAPYIFELANIYNCEKQTEIIMQSLTESEQFQIINLVDQMGNTPFMSQGLRGKSVERMMGLMKYCPPDKIIDYINNVNYSGKTALILFIENNSCKALRYLLSLVPEDKRGTYFVFHAQGFKAIITAKAYQQDKKVTILNEAGIELPAAYEDVTVDELNELMDEWSVIESFKSEYGATPWEVLGVALNAEDDDIKKAFRKAIIFSHPDRNQNSKDSAAQTKKIIAANRFLTDPEERKQYLKLS